MISLEEFVEHMENIDRCFEFQSKLAEVYETFGCFCPEFLDCIHDTYKLLEHVMNDESTKYLRTYIWDLDMGKEYVDGCVVDKEGNSIDISNLTKLYYVLISE